MIRMAIDLDNTLNASKTSIEFFSVLTHLLIAEHRITVQDGKMVFLQELLKETVF